MDSPLWRLPLILVVGLIALCALSGCTRPAATLNREQALAAVNAVRSARIETSTSSPDWLEVQADGSFRATGYLDGDSESWSDYSGFHYFVCLKVPEQVGPATVYHIVPLLLDSRTPVVYRGQPTSFRELSTPREGYDVPDPYSYWLEVRFTVAGSYLRAESMDFNNREVTWGPWPDEYPPVSTVSRVRLSRDASAPPGPGELWLDLSSTEPSVATVTGYLGGMTIDEAEDSEFAGSTDVTVPDRLGPAAIYHVVQVLYPRGVPQPLSAGLTETVDDMKPRTVAFRLDGSRFVAVDK